VILFTADWHLKLGQKNVPVQWAKKRYKEFFHQISEIESRCTTHIIGGDLFDRLPTMEELELYFSFVSNVKIPTIIYDGNHEATKKNKTFFSQLKEVTRDINKLVFIVDELGEYEDFTILPYCDLHKKNIFKNINKKLPLFTHVRGEIPPHVKPEIDLELLKDFPIVLAGDLHAHSNTQKNIVYPGSPMTTSFHRNEVETGYLLIDENFNWKWYKFDLPQLLRKTVDNPDKMIPSDYHHTIYELEGDIQDLSQVKNSELLDKKVVKRSTEATLVLDKEMTVSEELAEYLEYILELPKSKISSIIGTFNDYSKTATVE
jgi:DNA repair exonuclease SbcCD nuclease subunit|tara:strand:- start:624 stop:1574 length:951 start_codon:yes stop_codon:yes gene_type:complete